MEHDTAVQTQELMVITPQDDRDDTLWHQRFEAWGYELGDHFDVLEFTGQIVVHDQGLRSAVEDYLRENR